MEIYLFVMFFVSLIWLFVTVMTFANWRIDRDASYKTKFEIAKSANWFRVSLLCGLGVIVWPLLVPAAAFWFGRKMYRQLQGDLQGN